MDSYNKSSVSYLPVEGVTAIVVEFDDLSFLSVNGNDDRLNYLF